MESDASHVRGLILTVTSETEILSRLKLLHLKGFYFCLAERACAKPTIKSCEWGWLLTFEI